MFFSSTKLLLLVGGAIVALGFRAIHRVRAKRVLGALDEGKLCLRCDGRDTVIEGDRVRCETCGFSTSLTWIRESKVKESDITATAPGQGSTLLDAIESERDRPLR